MSFSFTSSNGSIPFLYIESDNNEPKILYYQLPDYSINRSNGSSNNTSSFETTNPSNIGNCIQSSNVLSTTSSLPSSNQRGAKRKRFEEFSNDDDNGSQQQPSSIQNKRGRKGFSEGSTTYLPTTISRSSGPAYLPTKKARGIKDENEEEEEESEVEQEYPLIKAPKWSVPTPSLEMMYSPYQILDQIPLPRKKRKRKQDLLSAENLDFVKSRTGKEWIASGDEKGSLIPNFKNPGQRTVIYYTGPTGCGK